MAEPTSKWPKPGWTWRTNLAVGLGFAAVGALVLTGQATRQGVPLPSIFGIPFLALGALVATGVLDRFRRPA